MVEIYMDGTLAYNRYALFHCEKSGMTQNQTCELLQNTNDYSAIGQWPTFAILCSPRRTVTVTAMDSVLISC